MYVYGGRNVPPLVFPRLFQQTDTPLSEWVPKLMGGL